MYRAPPPARPANSRMYRRPPFGNSSQYLNFRSFCAREAIASQILTRASRKGRSSRRGAETNTRRLRRGYGEPRRRTRSPESRDHSTAVMATTRDAAPLTLAVRLFRVCLAFSCLAAVRQHGRDCRPLADNALPFGVGATFDSSHSAREQGRRVGPFCRSALWPARACFRVLQDFLPPGRDAQPCSRVCSQLFPPPPRFQVPLRLCRAPC